MGEKVNRGRATNQTVQEESLKKTLQPERREKHLTACKIVKNTKARFPQGASARKIRRNVIVNNRAEVQNVGGKNDQTAAVNHTQLQKMGGV